MFKIINAIKELIIHFICPFFKDKSVKAVSGWVKILSLPWHYVVLQRKPAGVWIDGISIWKYPIEKLWKEG